MTEYEDPYHDKKIYHRAALWAQDGSGSVSPLCAKTPRRINLNRELWTICDDQVTCKRCLKVMAEVLKAKADAKI